MPKRFTATEKWDRRWFRELSNDYKLLWVYICDKCDLIGIWYVDIEQASFLIGAKLDEKEALRLFEKQIVVLNEGSKWWIKDFVSFQYGDLKPNNNLHKKVVAMIKSYPQVINSLFTSPEYFEGLVRASNAPQVKVKVKDKDY